MVHRDIEAQLIPLCLRRRVSVLSYSSLALGLLTGRINSERNFEGDDLRNSDPRFSAENRRKVAEFAATVRPLAEAHRATIAQLVIAWTASQQGIGFVLCGARNASQAIENADAGSLELTEVELAEIDGAASRHLVGVHV